MNTKTITRKTQILILVLASLLSKELGAQKIDRELVGTAGGTLNNGITLEYAIGEAVAGKLASENNTVRINQGFIQNTAELVSSTFAPEIIQGISVYPNPTADYIIINAETLNEATLEIHDQAGRQSASYEMKGGSIKLDLKHLNAGFYFLRLWNKDGFATYKINVYR